MTKRDPQEAADRHSRREKSPRCDAIPHAASPARRSLRTAAAPLAAAGIAAVVWGGSYLSSHPAPDANAATTVERSAGAQSGAGLSTAQVITVYVRPSAMLQDIVGGQRVAVSLPRGATVAALQDRLVASYPAIAPMMSSVLVSVSDEMQLADAVLSDGEVVDLIGQMSGG